MRWRGSRWRRWRGWCEWPLVLGGDGWYWWLGCCCRRARPPRCAAAAAAAAAGCCCWRFVRAPDVIGNAGFIKQVLNLVGVDVLAEPQLGAWCDVLLGWFSHNQEWMCEEGCLIRGCHPARSRE